MQKIHSTLLFAVLLGLTITVAAQTRPSTTQTPPGATLTIAVTDGGGAPLAGVEIHVTGPVDREAVTSDAGSARLLGLRTGTYRLRFSREGFITLERELSVKAGVPARADVMLHAAPAPPPPPAPEPVAAPEPPPAPPPLPPVAAPKTMSIPDFVEKNFVGRAGRKDSALACAGTSVGTLLQLREPIAGHTHEQSDEWIYVVAGEGTITINGQDIAVAAGTLSMVPRDATHALMPRGRNPLIVLSILSGERCEPLTQAQGF